MFCGSGGTKSRLATAAGVGPSWEMRNEKLRALVARNRFGSQNGKNIPLSDHFWKLRVRCSKNVRRCGEKCYKMTGSGS